MKETFRGPVLALALTLGASGAVIVADVHPAQAISLDAIGNGLKKAGKAVKKGAGKVAEELALDHAARNAKDIGKSMGEGFKGVGGLIKDGAKSVRRGGARFGGFLKDCALTLPCSFNPPQAKQVVKPPHGPGGWGGPARIGNDWKGPDKAVPDTGRTRLGTRKVAPPKRLGPTVVRDRSVKGRPLFLTPNTRRNGKGIKTPIARDRTIWGRPVGQVHVKQPTKPGRKIRGITRDNLKPSRKVNRVETRDLRSRRVEPRLRIRTKRHRKQDVQNRRGERQGLRLDRRSSKNIGNKLKSRLRKGRRG